jgi:hypothetical protein
MENVGNITIRNQSPNAEKNEGRFGQGFQEKDERKRLK